MTAAKGLDYTSERVNPEWNARSACDYLIYLFHLATYRFAEPYTHGREVLDYGCGTGYGTAMLARSAARVVGVDIDPQVIDHARRAYGGDERLEFRCIAPAEAGPLPFDDQSFDTVVSFQVIEHLAEPVPYLAEIQRVLRPSGSVVVATPDRSTRLFGFQKPWNMFHVTEYSRPRLERLMGDYFDAIEVLGMSGKPEVIARELRRTARMKWLFLPWTLPVVPEAVRRFVLGAVKKALAKRGRVRDDHQDEAAGFGFDESAIRIGPHSAGCVNLVAVARRR